MCYPRWNDAAMDLHRAAIMISVLHVSLRGRWVDCFVRGEMEEFHLIKNTQIQNTKIYSHLHTHPFPQSELFNPKSKNLNNNNKSSQKKFHPR